VRNVALFGQMYAGKSTIAQALVDAGFAKLSFAGPLKNVAALAYGPVGKTTEYEAVRDGGRLVKISGRQILQDVGQYMKHVDRDFWLKCFIRSSEQYLDQPLVVDDGRFTFERDALQKAGWLIVGINTPHAVRMQRAVALNGREPTLEEQNHESEVEVPDIVQNADIIVQGTNEAYDNARKILEAARA
jgi:hypothetical protein